MKAYGGDSEEKCSCGSGRGYQNRMYARCTDCNALISELKCNVCSFEWTFHWGYYGCGAKPCAACGGTGKRCSHGLPYAHNNCSHGIHNADGWCTYLAP